MSALRRGDLVLVKIGEAYEQGVVTRRDQHATAA